MSVAIPAEPVYYYECGAGRFRLVYFIPPDTVKRLQQARKISRLALRDFPDGIDLGCTEADFADLDASYGYRPPHDPAALQRAFYALLSTTRDWKTFRGSGFLPAADLERHLVPVAAALRAKGLGAGVTPRAPAATLRARRRTASRRAAVQARTARVLQAMPIEGIDARRPLRDQPFGRIRMKKGRPAEEVFVQLHQRKRR
jgi:hypothetical protein